MKALFLLLGLCSGIQLGFLIAVNDYLGVVCQLVPSFLFMVLSIKKKQVFPFLLAYTISFLIGIIALPIEGKNVFSGIVIRSSDNYFVLFSNFRRYYVYEKDNIREVGDILTINGQASAYQGAFYESRFDFGRYLASLGVRYQINASSISASFENPLRLKALENGFLNGLVPSAKGLTSSLLFGRKDYETEITSLADSMNLVFVISSSGLIYGFFLRELEKRISWKIDEGKAALITLLISFVVLPLGIHKIGIRRVFLTRLLRFINVRFLNKRYRRIEIISFAGIIMFALNPFDALQSGFQLGFGISMAFLLSERRIKDFGVFLPYLIRIIFLRLLILPFTLSSSSGKLHLLSGIYSQILLPLSILYTLISGATFLIPYVKGILNPLGEGYYYVLKGFSYLDPSIRLPPPSPLFYLLYYLILFLLILLLEIKAHRLAGIITISSLSIYALSCTPLPLAFTDQVSFINVGQGDSILIRDNLNTVLIDTGGNISFDMAEEVLIPFFRKERIDHIDYLFITHGDFDHDGAKDSLMRNFDVIHCIDSHSDFPIKIGGLTFTSYNIYGGNEENDLSLVLSVSLMGKKWLFTGDAPKKVEKNIIRDNPEIDCDVLKLGHHGSTTSTCPEWLDVLTPETVIVSCGRNNKYGHPHKEVIQECEKRGIEIRRTDQEGTITYRSFSFIGV